MCFYSAALGPDAVSDISLQNHFTSKHLKPDTAIIIQLQSRSASTFRPAVTEQSAPSTGKQGNSSSLNLLV